MPGFVCSVAVLYCLLVYCARCASFNRCALFRVLFLFSRSFILYSSIVRWRNCIIRKKVLTKTCWRRWWRWRRNSDWKQATWLNSLGIVWAISRYFHIFRTSILTERNDQMLLPFVFCLTFFHHWIFCYCLSLRTPSPLLFGLTALAREYIE